eukprot:GHVN01031005.1.p1 GENE.GHVN01031005.1~~GHVN01031005.1.p1  ORF type:complete len:463 (-),score=131.08 GHVN01031005.1:45-1433(-)
MKREMTTDRDRGDNNHSTTAKFGYNGHTITPSHTHHSFNSTNTGTEDQEHSQDMGVTLERGCDSRTGGNINVYADVEVEGEGVINKASFDSYTVIGGGVTLDSGNGGSLNGLDGDRIGLTSPPTPHSPPSPFSYPSRSMDKHLGVEPKKRGDDMMIDMNWHRRVMSFADESPSPSAMDMGMMRQERDKRGKIPTNQRGGDNTHDHHHHLPPSPTTSPPCPARSSCSCSWFLSPTVNQRMNDIGVGVGGYGDSCDDGGGRGIGEGELRNVNYVNDVVVEARQSHDMRRWFVGTRSHQSHIDEQSGGAGASGRRRPWLQYRPQRGSSFVGNGDGDGDGYDGDGDTSGGETRSHLAAHPPHPPPCFDERRRHRRHSEDFDRNGRDGETEYVSAPRPLYVLTSVIECAPPSVCDFSPPSSSRPFDGETDDNNSTDDFWRERHEISIAVRQKGSLVEVEIDSDDDPV